MAWENTMRLRCPADTDPTPVERSRHVAYDVRLPLDVGALARVTESLSACACGARLVIRTEDSG